MKLRSAEAELFHGDGQRTDVTELIVGFSNVA